MKRIYDMIIIGGGPGGYTAALYAARAGLDVIVLEKLSAGGQMALSHQIDNYPGFEEGIDGFTLAEKMEQSALRFGAQSELAEVKPSMKRVSPSEWLFTFSHSPNRSRLSSMARISPSRPPRHMEMTSIISPCVPSAPFVTVSICLNVPDAPMKIVLTPHALTMIS